MEEDLWRNPGLRLTIERVLMGVLYSRNELAEARAKWRAEGKTVVFTNGCYDIQIGRAHV